MEKKRCYNIKKYAIFCLIMVIVHLNLTQISYAALRMPTKEVTFKKHIIEVYGIKEEAEEKYFKQNYRNAIKDYKSRLTLYVDANYAVGRTNVKTTSTRLYLYNWSN